MSVSGWSTFRRFEDVPIRIGPIAINVKDWSRPHGGESRLFASGVLEGWGSRAGSGRSCSTFRSASRRSRYASNAGFSLLAIAVQYVAGLPVWSLVEYIAHRFVFQRRAGVAIKYLIRGVHHAYPDDARGWMLPLGMTLRLPPRRRPLSLHSARAPGPIAVVRWLRVYHMLDHDAAPDRQFGISSALWDVVFKTK